MNVLRAEFGIMEDKRSEDWPSERQLKTSMAAISKKLLGERTEERKKIREGKAQVQNNVQCKKGEIHGSRYRIPTTYGAAIDTVMEKVANIKPGMVEGLVCAHLGIEEANKPADFPSTQ